MPGKIVRDDAITILTDDGLAKMSHDERAEQLECMMSEDWASDPEWRHIPPNVQREFEEQAEIDDPNSMRYDAVLRLAIKEQFAGATNEYIAELCRDIGHDYESVVGQHAELVPCPCCGACSLSSRGDYDICRVCWWEDDGQDNHNADTVMGGPNYHLSLTQARVNYLESGISDPARTDLRQHQDPVRKYSQGRSFVLSADKQTVTEPDANWQGKPAAENSS